MDAGSGKRLLFTVFLLHLCTANVLCIIRQCPPCGNQSIPYPLSTSSDCGHPHYTLSCTHSLLQLQATSGSYAVRDIIPAARLLTLHPAPLRSNAASCISQDFVHSGLVLNQSQPFTVTPANSLFLFNCTQMMLGSPLNCTDKSLCHEAVLATGDSPCKPLLCCMLAEVTTMHLFGFSVNESSCSAYSSVVNLDESLPPERWNYGVQLHWETPKEPACAAGQHQYCPLHSVCRTNSSAGVGVCRCTPGYFWSPPDGLCKKGKLSSREASHQFPVDLKKSHHNIVDQIACLARCFIFTASFDAGLLLRYRRTLIGGVTSSLLVFSIIISLVSTALYRRRQVKRREKAMLMKERSLFLNSNNGRATLFTAKEMKLATDNFDQNRLLGRGGFGEVYKGLLRDGNTVAIKVARLGNVKGCDQVLNEVRILSQINHRNVVRLLGCCIDAEQPLMVYEYVSNGALFDHLNHSRSANGSTQMHLTWERRLRIAKETAEGLSYLHSFAHPPIIHRDIKSSNILLDANMIAKVSDFGLSRLVQDDATHISTCAQGTLGYLDPHYYRSYQLSDKSDVYSFGIVLLELVTSQRVIDFTRDADDVNLAAYVWNRHAEGSLDEVFDPLLVRVATETEMICMRELAVLAVMCSDEDGGKRPRMEEVAHHIDGMLRKLTSMAQPS